MKKMRAAVLAALFLVAGAAWAQGISQGTVDIGGTRSGGPSAEDLYYQGVPAVTDVATHEGVGKATEEFAGFCEENAKKSKTLAKTGGWMQSAKKFLDKIDIVSSGAKVAAYLVEGDKTGAASVLLQEMSKKGCSALGATLFGWIPVVGPTAGAAGGEEFSKAFINPKVEERENKLRNSEYAQKYLNKPWLTPTLVMDWKGNVRELPEDMYIDKETKTVKRRTPEEQKRHEEKAYVKYHDGRQLNNLQEQYEKGEISKEKYESLVDDYRKRRDKSKPWKPPAEPDKEDDGEAKEDGDAEGDEEGEGEESEEEEEEAEEEETEDEEEEEEEKDNGILNFVTPEVVVATAVDEQDLSAGEFINIATTIITIKFYNVGSMADGYGGAAAHMKTTFTMHPAVEETTCAGTFSGGPNGTLRLNCDGEVSTFSLSNGQSIRGGGLNFTVQNPGAFANWPSQYR